MTPTKAKDLRDLLADATAEPPRDQVTATATEGRAKPQPSDATPAAPTATAGQPRYLSFERKEARLTRDQADALTQLTRSLNRARGSEGERLTDNTLIRVAVDLLLARVHELQGHNEAELRNSVGL